MTERVSSKLVSRFLDSRFLAIVVIFFAITFIISRSTFLASSSGGDIAVWMFVHEWTGRGIRLYEGVWDHKDWGFYVITAQFYRFGGISGLFMSGLGATLIFSIGTYLSVRCAVQRHKAALITALLSAGYVAAPSFLSTYTENYAIAFAIFGIGLLARYPFLAGIAFAVSSSIKISGLMLFLLVFASTVVLSLFRKQRGYEPRLQNVVRFIAGFTLTAAAVLVAAATQGVLRGWIDVIRFNVEYGRFRRRDRPPLHDIDASLQFFNPGVPTIIFLISLLIALIFALTFAFISGNRNSSRVWPITGIECLVLNATLLVGSSISVFAQYPPSFQHYQYLVGPALSTLAVLVSLILCSSAPMHVAKLIISCVLLVVPLMIGSRLVVESEGAGFVRSGLLQWIDPDLKNQSFVSLEGVPDNSSVAFVDVGGWFATYKSIRTDIDMVCRFFYHLPHQIPRFGQEIIDCLKDNPDFIVVRSHDFADEIFRDRVRDVLRERFRECTTEDRIFELWSRRSVRCPVGL